MGAYDKYIWDYFMGKINNAYGVAGLMGNLFAESALNPKNLQQSYETSLGYTDDSYTAAVDSGQYSKSQFVHDSAGYGLAQWTYWSRKQNLYEYWKNGTYESIGSIELACDFLYYELSKSYKGVLNTLKNATSVREASNKVLHDFEKPADQSEAVEIKRAGYGQGYYDTYAEPVLYDYEAIKSSAVSWIEAIANDDSHGYDQTNRWGPDYDCSSLVIEAYEQAGMPVKTNGATYTGNMVDVFMESGFERLIYDRYMEMKAGDVLWVEGHTAMYIGDGYLVEAYSNENGEATGGEPGDQTTMEIRTSIFPSTSQWSWVLRLPSNEPVIPEEPEEPTETKKHSLSFLMLLLATKKKVM